MQEIKNASRILKREKKGKREKRHIYLAQTSPNPFYPYSHPIHIYPPTTQTPN